MKLNQLKVGERAVISSFSLLSDQVKKRLMIMGALPNTEVKLVRRAPMGDPLQLEFRGVSMAISSSIAAQIEVEVR